MDSDSTFYSLMALILVVLTFVIAPYSLYKWWFTPEHLGGATYFATGIFCLAVFPVTVLLMNAIDYIK